MARDWAPAGLDDSNACLRRSVAAATGSTRFGWPPPGTTVVAGVVGGTTVLTGVSGARVVGGWVGVG
jgi:hypothetical protein